MTTILLYPCSWCGNPTQRNARCYVCKRGWGRLRHDSRQFSGMIEMMEVEMLTAKEITDILARSLALGIADESEGLGYYRSYHEIMSEVAETHQYGSISASQEVQIEHSYKIGRQLARAGTI